MNSVSSDDARKINISEIKEDKDKWIYYASIASSALYIVYLKSVGAAGGWWIALWAVIGFLLVGLIGNVVEVVTVNERKLRELSDEELAKLAYEIKQKDSFKDKGKLFLFMMFVIFAVMLFWNNPTIDQIETVLDEKGSSFSNESHTNYFLFSIYSDSSQVSQIRPSHYIALYNRVFQIPF